MRVVFCLRFALCFGAGRGEGAGGGRPFIYSLMLKQQPPPKHTTLNSPANWKPGGESMKADPKGSLEYFSKVK